VSNWKKISSQALFDHPLLSLERQTVTSPSGEDHQALVLHSPDWVNVIPLLADGGVVLVRQWRYGIEESTLEIPGGVVENESSREAAERELLEETGYRAREWRLLGSVTPNPAILSNRCATWLATDLERVGEATGDGEEELEVEIVSLDHIPELIRSGAVHHALVIAAFQLLEVSGR
jgi:ADP-ribose pyrophosphatase